MSSSGATPVLSAWPLRGLRRLAQARAVSAAEAVAFPEVVWAHFLRQRELRRDGELHGSADAEYRKQLVLFSEEHGALINAYWCTHEASAVALTEKPGKRVAGVFARRLPSIRFHAATDWATSDAPEIGHALHTCETLAIRVSEVLSGTSERIAMQWIMSVASYLLGVVDQAKGKPTAAEVSTAVRRARGELAQIERYYDRAGEKTGRLVYFAGMMLGVAALAALAVVGGGLYAIFGSLHLHSVGTQTFFTCYGMGAIGALVSVMSRMASGIGGSFSIDYEVGRRSIRRVGSFRPVIGAIFAVVLYFALRGDLLQIQASSAHRTTYFYAALAFLAGFSERRAKIILGSAERVLGNPDDPTRSAPTSGPTNSHQTGGGKDAHQR